MVGQTNALERGADVKPGSGMALLVFKPKLEGFKMFHPTKTAQSDRDAAFVPPRLFFGRPLDAWRHVAIHRFAKLRLGLKYGLGMTLTRDEAYTLFYDGETLCGVAVLASIDVDGTLGTARDRFVDHPRLEEFIAEGVEHVRRKWCGNGDMTSDAEDWAIEQAVEYAARDGVEFTPLDDMLDDAGRAPGDLP